MKKLLLLIFVGLGSQFIDATEYQTCRCKDKTIRRVKNPKDTAEEECPWACSSWTSSYPGWSGEDTW